jgi:UDP-N-acetylglucosamine--N-acetylmuramyl-(pentapeptide) pyrophosphoryl-undecaprenol N-acetylglucosamine transferase
LSSRHFAVVTGGGTAGHVLPAIAVAEALVAAGHDHSELHYIGARRGIETSLVPPTGIGHTFLDVVGFQRALTRRNLGFVPKMLRARREAIGVLRELRPRVVVSVGGYASFPTVLAARRLKIPILVVSYDRVPGRASMLSARWAAASAVAFGDSPLPRAVVTGAPVRQAVLDVDRVRDGEIAKAALGVPADRFLVVVTGGSQGSGILNQAVRDLVRDHTADRHLAIRHAVGERFLAAAPEPLDGSGGVLYQPIGFDSQLPLSYAAADLLVGRGGASTVHEVAVTGVPAVLVPWSGAAEDHQHANVSWLSDAGGALRLSEHEVPNLPAIIDHLRTHPERRLALGAIASEMGAVHRSGGLAQLIESIALA